MSDQDLQDSVSYFGGSARIDAGRMKARVLITLAFIR